MRAPQGAILALTERHAEAPLPPATTVRIRDLARRTLALADGFVHLSRARSAPLASDLLDLAEIARDAAEALWAPSRSRAMPVEVEAPQHGPVLIRGDGALLHRALANMIDNALKYGTAGTTVKVQVHADSNTATVTVTNCGADIPGELVDRLFERFERGDQPDGSCAGQVGGIGLGLALVRAAAQRHGGSATCHSAGGTTAFVVTLPRQPAE